MLIAADRRQARVVYRYISGLLHATPMLEGMIANETKEAIELTNRITIEIHAASYRSIRGYTVVAAICDEIAFWRTDDSANPDTEILYALRPTMATVPGGLMLCISSPYALRGELYRAYRDHYGRASDVLVWQADTRTMNPTVPETFITEAYAQDAAVAAAEYGAEFRRNIESFVSREAVEACVVPDRHALPPVSGTTYRAFTGLWTYDRADDGARTTAQQEVRIRPHVALESRHPLGIPAVQVGEDVERWRGACVRRLVPGRGRVWGLWRWPPRTLPHALCLGCHQGAHDLVQVDRQRHRQARRRGPPCGQKGACAGGAGGGARHGKGNHLRRAGVSPSTTTRPTALLTPCDTPRADRFASRASRAMCSAAAWPRASGPTSPTPPASRHRSCGGRRRPSRPARRGSGSSRSRSG